MNGILTAQSGQPFWPSQGTAGNRNAPGSSQTPDQVKAAVAILGGTGTGHPYFDTTAYAPVNIPAGQAQRFGNTGSNNIRGPGIFTLDPGLFRTFPAGERFHLQFRAEALKMLIHPNFSQPASNISGPTTFGYITSTNTSDRQFRFAMRVFF